MSEAVLIESGMVVSMDAKRSVGLRDILVRDGRIASIGMGPTIPPGTRRIDASGMIVMPGLLQAHTHLCQTLCRGAADALPLLEWRRERVWRYEASLDDKAMRACTRLAAAELLLGGTTAILDMGTVHETDALCDAVAATGLRATVGKAMMDEGDGVP